MKPGFAPVFYFRDDALLRLTRIIQNKHPANDAQQAGSLV
jgi:hypothetical protein